MSRVLLLEEGWYPTLHLARALEELGHTVTVLTANGARAEVQNRTVTWLSAPPFDSADFDAQLDHRVRTLAIDHVVPLTERGMRRLWDSNPAWIDRVFPTTQPWQQRLLRNKHTLLAHMAACGIDVPRQLRLEQAHDIGAPLVIKEATGEAGNRVWIVDDANALDHAVARARALGGDWAAQEFIDGPTYLVAGLFQDGHALRVYAAKKVEQYPPRTGPAVRLRSTDDADLIDSALRVLRELRWTGFASLDFIRRRDGRFALLEVNPRLWGSVAATLSAGVELFEPFAEQLAGRLPAADLTYEMHRESTIFPRYLLSRRYHNLAGAGRLLRDLWSGQGQEWRSPKFLLHLARRWRGHVRIAS